MKYYSKSYNKKIILTLCIIIFLIQPTIISQSKQIKGNQYYLNLLSETTIFTTNIEIVNPRCSVPVFAIKNSTFKIILKGSLPTSFSVYLTTAYETVVDDIWLPIQRVQSSNSTYEVTVIVPVFTPVELYNLTILINNNGVYQKLTEPRCVQVIDVFKDTFSFIHITDFHIGDLRGLSESIKETIGWKSIKRCIDEINIIRPDFVLISGDLVFGQLYPFEYHREYKVCYEMIQEFDVPTFLAPGNHDGYNRILEDGFSYWQDYFGPLYYSFDYGNYHFQAINSYDMSKIFRLTFLFIPLNWGGSISDEQLNWIEQDLQQHSSKHTIQFMHHNPLWDTGKDSLIRKDYENRENLLNIIDEYNVDMVLAGHVHWDSVNIENDTIFITTTTPESEIRVFDGYWGYRLIEIKDNDIYKYNYKEPKYSIPSYHLKVNNWQEGRLAFVEFTNKLECDIICHAEVIIPAGEYQISEGTFIQQRTQDRITQLFISCQVPADSIKTVFISSI